MKAVIRTLVGETTSLSVPLGELTDEADLYEAGMSSFEVITLLVAVEKRFGIRFAPEAMGRDTFATINAIHDAVAEAGVHE